METKNSKPQDTRLAGVKCDVPPSNSSWLKRSDKSARTACARGATHSRSRRNRPPTRAKSVAEATAG
jgi:hypothetical protein